MSRTPSHVLKEAHRFDWRGEYKELPQGAFVRPIEYQYIPKEVLEDRQFSMFNLTIDVFCYTRYGIIPIPKHKLREV